MAFTVWKPLESIKTKYDAIMYMEAVLEDIRENGFRDMDETFFFISLRDLVKLCKKKGWME